MRDECKQRETEKEEEIGIVECKSLRGRVAAGEAAAEMERQRKRKGRKEEVRKSPRPPGGQPPCRKNSWRRPTLLLPESRCGNHRPLEVLDYRVRDGIGVASGGATWESHEAAASCAES